MLHIHRSDDVDSLWKEVALPWLNRAARQAWQHNASWSVVVPKHSLVQDIKRRWLNTSAGALGVQFLTPRQCRAKLMEFYPAISRVASKSTLELLLSTQAQTHHTAFAESVKKDPTLLLDTLLSLSAANLDPAVLDQVLGSSRDLVRDFLRLLERVGLQLPGRVDWQLQEQQPPEKKPLGPILLWGFDSNHWPLFPLLQAITENSSETHLAALSGWVETTQPEALWQSTWEAFVKKWNNTWQEHASEKTFFSHDQNIVISPDDKQQAVGIIHHLLQIIHQNPAAKVAIAIPTKGTLLSEIRHTLTKLNIPALDLIGAARISETHQMLLSWVELQEKWDASSLISYITKCPAAASSHGYSSQQQLIKIFSSAAADYLSTDLDILQAALASQQHQQRPFSRLSEQPALTDFLLQINEFFDTVSWPEAMHSINDALAEIRAAPDMPMQRGPLLKWVLSVLQPGSRRDTPHLREFFAGVILVQIDQAPWIEKSHLIIAGQNDHLWPPKHRCKTWLDTSEVRTLNESLSTPSPHGAGEFCIKPGHALLMAPNLMEQIALRNTQLCTNNISTNAAHFASALDLGTNRPTQPSPTLTDILIAKETSWENLTQAATSAQGFLAEEIEKNEEQTLCSAESLKAMLAAYSHRRDSDTPFGKYDFSTGENAPYQDALPAKILSEAGEQPTHIWHSAILRIKPQPDTSDLTPTALFVGNKLHALLKDLHPGARTEKNPPDLVSLVTKRLDHLKHNFSEIIRTTQPTPGAYPVLLQFALEELSQKLTAITTQLEQILGPRTIESEVSFKNITTQDGLCLSARIDAILRDPAGQEHTIIIDYKSGSTSPPPKKDLLQLLLYREILKAQGMLAIARTLTAEDKGAQLPHEGMPKSITRQYRTLLAAHAHSCFPILSPLRDNYSHALQLPIAILPIRPDIIQNKLSHWLPETDDTGDILEEENQDTTP